MAKHSLTPQQQKKLLMGLAAAIGAVVWFTFLFIPQRRAWLEDRLQIVELRRQLADFRGRQAEVPRMQEDLERLKSQYETPGPVRPPEEQLPELLKALTEMAHASGVRFVGAKPTSEVNRLVPGESGYLELQVMAVVIGGYHPIAAFLDRLENSPELVRVRELLVVHDPESPMLSQHAALFLLQAYLVPSRPQEAKVPGSFAPEAVQ